jgi:Protein NO VEIN, C-terminal
MWVVGYLIEQGVDDDLDEPSVDWADELKLRQRRAAERERRGLLGEQLVLKSEQTLLVEAGRTDLADKVSLVSAESRSFGYDVLSFTPTGDERHIEVKTTSRSREADQGFWLSDHERKVAEGDPHWTLVRVCHVDVRPDILDMGNIMKHEVTGWTIEPDTWYVGRLRHDEPTP